MSSAPGSRPAVTDPFASEWVRRPPTALDLHRDALLAALLAAGAYLSAILSAVLNTVEGSAPLWVIALWSVCLPLPLVVRRRYPAAAALAVAVVYFTGAYLRVPEAVFSQICLFVAFYTVGAWCTNRRRSIVVRVVIVVGMLTWVAYSIIAVDWMGSIVPPHEGEGGMSPYAAYSTLAFGLNLLYFGAAWVFGETSRLSARRLEALEARTAELDEERIRSSRQAVSLERVRIARELHDVVAHHVSVMGVQAGAARLVLDRDPVKARTALSAIEENARSAVDELHRMLVALRADDLPESARPVSVTGRPATTATITTPGLDRPVRRGRGSTGAALPSRPAASVPEDYDECCGARAGSAASDAASTRGLEQLEELVATTRGAGTSVSFRTIGDSRPVPATVGLSLYRVAQESLTNVRKHAGPGAVVDMRLRWLDGAVELEVSDHDGARPPATVPPARQDAGLGQTGMRERIAAVGGSIEMGPSSRGGYLVRARVPLAGAPAVSTGSDGALASSEGMTAHPESVPVEGD